MTLVATSKNSFLVKKFSAPRVRFQLDSLISGNFSRFPVKNGLKAFASDLTIFVRFSLPAPEKEI